MNIPPSWKLNMNNCHLNGDTIVELYVTLKSELKAFVIWNARSKTGYGFGMDAKPGTCD